MLDVIVMQLPGTMNDRLVLFNLIRSKSRACCGPMRADGHDVGRAIRQPDTCAGERNLHHVLRKVTRWMHHVLMRGSDAATGSVIVGAKVGRRTATASSSQQQRKIDSPFAIN